MCTAVHILNPGVVFRVVHRVVHRVVLGSEELPILPSQ
jgi:hypothetical protein